MGQHNSFQTMPLYEYQCDKCGHRFEKIRKFSDKAIKKCPECGGHVEQLISAPAVQFKGSGWYVTDYANKSTASSSGESGGDSKSGDSKKEDKRTETTGKDGTGKEGAGKSSSKESSKKSGKQK
jgi:putative FmdB family regulatory protein